MQMKMLGLDGYGCVKEHFLFAKKGVLRDY